MIRVVRVRPLLSTLLAGTCLSTSVLAVEPSGSVVRVDPAVSAAGAAGARTLEVEGAVFVGDEIVASPNGLAQIRFVDDTRLVIGPNSRLTIDTFVFNPDNTARQLTINALKGAFRFISGKSPPQAYSVRTPTMSLGMRGTVVDISVRGEDSSAAYIEGSGDVCDASGACVIAEGDCTIHVVPPSGGVSTPGPLETQQRLAAYFPFISNQSALALSFRADTSGCAVVDSRLFGPPSEREAAPFVPYQ